MNTSIKLRKIHLADSAIISAAFAAQGWDKPVTQFQRYYDMQAAKKRDIIIAEWQNEFAGYLTVNWQSFYLPFYQKNIPEIVDFNVLKRFQRLGIGTALMDEAEARISKVSDFAGIGFGVYKDYGAAQILYIKRGYIPDGNGIIKNGQSLKYGDKVIIGDHLVFCLTKKLS